MNAEQRLRAVLSFEEPDRPWFAPTIGFWPETLDRWRKEGMPPYIIEPSAYLYFGFDHFVPMFIGSAGTPGLFPPFIPVVLKKEDRHEIIRDFTGSIFRKFTDGSSTIPQFLEAPVKNMDDFRKLKWRLQPDFPGRCENPVFDAMHIYAKVRGIPAAAMVCGLFGFHRHLVGVESLMTAYYDSPELIHAISRQWVKLTKGAIRRLKKRYGIMVVMFWEDMCFRSGPLISPNTFRKFMTPFYKEVIDDAKDNGIEFFMVDTDGDCNIVIPLFMEVGVNGLFPFEVQSGMDILKVREQYPRLAIWGGLDKRLLALTKEDIEREVFEKVPKMLASGGYMPAIDHSVPPDVPLENFKYFMKLLKSQEITRR